MSTLPQSGDDPIARLTTLIRLVSDDTRLRLLLLIADGERDVSSLCTAMALPQPTVSHHLGLLLMQQVVTARRAGKRRFYSLDDSVADWVNGALDLRTEDAVVRIAPWPCDAVSEMPRTSLDGATAVAAAAHTLATSVPSGGGDAVRSAAPSRCPCSSGSAQTES